MNIAILGSTGMLGSMVTEVLGGTPVNRDIIDAREPDLGVLEEFDWTVNCIGLIKPYCSDVEAAIKVNALFPHNLPHNTIQIATDCVYSGLRGAYVESDPHDATDAYGQTKSLGENPNIHNLRCSIIGPEVKNHISLLDWFLSQKEQVNGFTNHLWNGLTTYHFAQIVNGAIENNLELPSLQHIVPGDVVTKGELLEIIAEVYKKDIIIRPVEADERVDRTLSTNNPKLNLTLWKAAGYEQPPTIRQMIEELYERY